LIGCPVRVTVGEKGLKVGMVELKLRKGLENQPVPVETIVEQLTSMLA
jgi:prolyl-tRNA synthetase